MDTKKIFNRMVSITAGIFVVVINAQGGQSDHPNQASPKTTRVLEHWTPERLAKAIPRDLVLDDRRLGYLRKPDGTLQPYGHDVAAMVSSKHGSTPYAAPSVSSDTVPPDITNMNPSANATIGASSTFSAEVTDASGVKSVTFVIKHPNGTTTQSFTASRVGSTKTWTASLQGFSDGDWSWQVVAKDFAPKGGNTASSSFVAFAVDTSDTGNTGSTGDSGGTGVITNAEWIDGGDVQTAAGRLYFEMPANPRWKTWNGYVCSGTVAKEALTGRSIIITAAHCVYDDANKAFARNVMFIPNQSTTTGTGTDLNCNNDPQGCWVPSFGVVDYEWTNKTFPNNIAWDYAYYVVPDSGAHLGAQTATAALDNEAGSLNVDFNEPLYLTDADITHALGYSYSDDPNFMYCAEDMTIEGAVNWWLPSCGLSGGASGGPWLQPVADGEGPIISVNSWGYTTSPGMAGPKLNNNSAGCLFAKAKSQDFTLGSTDGKEGIAVSNCSLP